MDIQADELLFAINKELPEEIHARFIELHTKQKGGYLSEGEREELMNLVDAIEAAEAERLVNMIALAELWGITFEELRKRLGGEVPEPYVW
jgi:hypothetical protein